jgi:hypothetical protein
MVHGAHYALLQRGGRRHVPLQNAEPGALIPLIAVLYVLAIGSVWLATKAASISLVRLDGSRIVSRRNNTVAVGSAACEKSRVWLVLQLAGIRPATPEAAILQHRSVDSNPDRTVGYRYEARAQRIARVGLSFAWPRLFSPAFSGLAIAEDKLDLVTAL